MVVKKPLLHTIDVDRIRIEIVKLSKYRLKIMSRSYCNGKWHNRKEFVQASIPALKKALDLAHEWIENDKEEQCKYDNPWMP